MAKTPWRMRWFADPPAARGRGLPAASPRPRREQGAQGFVSTRRARPTGGGWRLGGGRWFVDGREVARLRGGRAAWGAPGFDLRGGCRRTVAR